MRIRQQVRGVCRNDVGARVETAWVGILVTNILPCSVLAITEGGITASILFVKALAELKGEDMIAFKRTMALAVEHGLGSSVDEMLQRSAP